MAASARLICAAADLLDGGTGIKFPLADGRQGFVIRHRGRVHGYVNECGHTPVNLDRDDGRFFDDSKLYLICATHGALYAPETGACLGGRCAGRGLAPLPVEERDGSVYLIEEAHVG